MSRKPLEIPPLPPLWETPAPFRPSHNGGPPLESRRPGRPSTQTEEVCDRILELLGEGLPLAEICRVEGMPPAVTVRGWRRKDPEFNSHFEVAAQMGREHLAVMVSAQFDEIIRHYPPRVARRWWNLRCRQLIRVNAKFFGGGSR